MIWVRFLLRVVNLTNPFPNTCTRRWFGLMAMQNITIGENESTTCGCQRLAVGCLIQDKKSKSRKGHYSGEKNDF